ncbi:MAG: DNA polymerase III subunit [Candidatus Atribacteria bacterium]|nr:DNA polymerase III subunit [Candidatus Atribacteria bacterium]
MSWSEICGHEFQKQFFQRVFQNQTQSHSYLFSGPEGIGKTTFAFEVARLFNCEHPTRDGSCGSCQNCRLINARTHPDVLLLSPRENKILIEDVRDFIFRLGLQRVYGKFRVGIVESTELFSKEEIQNCLLKTVEEPPEKSIIILITSQVQALLPTLLSRCQRINFQLLHQEKIKEFIQKKYTLSDQKALNIAEHSLGCLRNAFSLAEGNQPFIEKSFFLWDWITGENEIFSLGPWFTENKDNIIEILSQLEWYLRDIMLFQFIAGKSERILTFSRYKKRVIEDASRLSPGITSRFILAIEQLEKDLKSNLHYDTTLLHFVLMVREELNSAPRCWN